MSPLSKLFGLGGVALAATILPLPAMAATDPETAFILNSLSFLLHGFIVMLMAAGFCMLEVGLVRSKNATAQCAKNIGLYSISGLLYWLIGYNLMYADVGGYIGSLSIWSPSDPSITDAGYTGDGTDYAASSDWFFQMVFVAAAASIVSGAVAERVKLTTFFVVIAVLVGIIYPIQGSWTWGGGWLSELGFSDFAGSTIVHSVGGWAALTGAIIIGARKGKYSDDGSIRPMPGSNLPLATLGTFILWFGWFGFNGGSQLAMGTAADVAAIANIYVNTNIAAAAGVVVAIVATLVMYGKIDLTMALNGALGGLVSITAEPLAPTPGIAAMIGGIGGFLVVLSVPLLDKLKVDDVVGAIPVHLVCGIWGTLAVVISAGGGMGQLMVQATGIVAIGAFVVVTSGVAWYAIGTGMGLRPDEEAEYDGLDVAECGLEGYPEFTRSS